MTQRERTRQDWEEHHDKRERELAEENSSSLTRQALHRVAALRG